MKVFSIASAAALMLMSNAAAAGETKRCLLEYTCANINACQTPKSGKGLEFEYEILAEDKLRLNLGRNGLPVLNLRRISQDLMTAYGWDPTRSTSYTFSVFGDGMVAYTTHSFVGRGVSLTGFGRCEVNG